MRGNEDEKLDALFRAYRDGCPAPEPSANFMPESLGEDRIAADVHVFFPPDGECFCDGGCGAFDRARRLHGDSSRPNPYFAQTYVEALAEANPLDAPDVLRRSARILAGSRNEHLMPRSKFSAFFYCSWSL